MLVPAIQLEMQEVLAKLALTCHLLCRKLVR